MLEEIREFEGAHHQWSVARKWHTPTKQNGEKKKTPRNSSGGGGRVIIERKQSAYGDIRRR